MNLFFNLKMRGNTKDVDGEFVIVTKIPTEDVGIGTYDNDVEILPHPFKNPSLDPSSCKTVGGDCNLVIKFTPVNNFPNKSNGGQIIMTIPSDLGVKAEVCSASLAGKSMECTIDGDSVTITHDETASVSGKEIVVSLPSLTAPTSTKPTTSFTVHSQEKESGVFYNIDGVNSGLSLSASILGAITDAKVTRDALNSDNDGLRVDASTNFKFSFKISSQVPSDGVFSISVPSNSQAKISSTEGGITCNAGDCGSGATLSCSISETRTILISGY